MELTGGFIDTLLAPPIPSAAGLKAPEAMNLAFALVGAAILVFLRRSRLLPPLPRMYAGFGFLLCACAATILEGYAWAPLFNLVEHLALALSGVAFALSLHELGHPRFRGDDGGAGKGPG